MSKFRHRLVLANSIESRDGTLNADSKMKNMVAENVEGELVAVKRPGITSDVELPPGLAQGLFSLNGLAYAIIDDALFESPQLPLVAVEVRKAGQKGVGADSGGSSIYDIPGIVR
jgi:hypothetical protein